MLAQENTIDLVGEINKLYLALIKTNHSPTETARTINSILLNQGVPRQELSQAWDEWYLKNGGSKKDPQ